MGISVIGGSTGGGGGQTYEKIFYSSDTWEVPAGCKTVEVTMLGGGGGYGGSYGGGAGAFFKGVFDVSNESSIPITIGSGGTGTSTTGNKGGSTTFGAFATANGGLGGVNSPARGGDSGSWANHVEADPRAETSLENKTSSSASASYTGTPMGVSNNWFAVNGDIIIATYAFRQATTYLRSTDGGDTWTTHSAPSSNNYNYVFWVPSAQKFYYITNGGLWTSDSGSGGTWTYVGSLSGINMETGIVFDGTQFWGRSSSNSQMLCYSNNGYSYSTTGVQSPYTMFGMRYTNGWIFSMPNLGSDYRFQATNDGGQTWRTYSGSYYMTDIVYLPALDKYALSYAWNTSSVHLLQDTGTAFSYVQTIGSASYTCKITCNPSNPNEIVYNLYNTLKISTDGGATFTTLSGADFYFDSSGVNYALGIVGSRALSTSTSSSTYYVKTNALLPPAVPGYPGASPDWLGTYAQYFGGASLAMPRMDFQGSSGTPVTQFEDYAVLVHPVLRFSGFGGFYYAGSNVASTNGWVSGALGLGTDKMLSRLSTGFGNGGIANTSGGGQHGTSGIVILRYSA